MPSRREFLSAAALTGTGVAALSLAGGPLGCAGRRKPNVVVILADDLGYGDLGCYGATDIETPNLDRMAAEGLRFTSFCVPQAVCSASRAALLTGCYPNRVSVLHALMPWAENGIGPDEETIAELLHERGYACGVFGKWHLGHHPEFLPLRHGFGEYFGLPYSNDMWPVGYDGVPVGPDDNKARYPWPPLIDGDARVGEIRTLADQDRLTELYTDRAVRFIKKNKARPFFLYVPHSMPHVPLGVSAEFRGRSRRGPYGDVIMEIDASVGRIPRTIDGLDLLPLILGETAASPREELYYFYGTELHAVRRGRWKLHVPHAYPSYEGQEAGRGGFPGPTVRRETGYALYDLESDIGERTNLVERFPDLVADLMGLADKARADLGDGPKPGPGVRPGGRARS